VRSERAAFPSEAARYFILSNKSFNFKEKARMKKSGGV
jgi:hypothetical protein